MLKFMKNIPLFSDTGQRALCGIRKRDGGFTLLEVMIAVAIMAIALTALYGSQSRSLSYAIEARFYTVATSLAESRLAELQAGLSEPMQESGDFGEMFPGYHWRIATEVVSLHDVVASAPAWKKLRKIDLSIEWSDSPFIYSIRYYLPAGHR